MATSASTVCDPIKPAPPVTRIRINNLQQICPKRFPFRREQKLKSGWTACSGQSSSDVRARLANCGRLQRPASDRVVTKVERAHQCGIIQVAPVEDYRLLERSLDPMEIRMTKLVPFGQDDQRVGPRQCIVVGFVVADAIAEDSPSRTK